ncbi:MAG: hypothetical protein Q9190_007581 [Brigantiaea leucoxantha]
MADQNISQILAALAAQRPGGTPLQGQPPQHTPPIHGYPPPVYPAPTPPAAAGAYAIPQPSNSGSLDLSNIKPSNSGSVSLADAVAKARGIAASYGSSSRDGDPRLTSRGAYRRSRSRSRSPPRIGRESYRDNYNPYRDERRDDSRRNNVRGYSRDRSFSPGPRGRSNYSPLTGRGYGVPVERSPPGRRSVDEGHETITIESSLVGLIIGRSGENLRRVENDTGSRVQFVTGPEASGPMRQCKITGSRAARDNAKSEIFRIISENGKETSSKLAPATVGVKGAGSHAPALRAGEDATQIMVPNRTVGLIIGRGGETIRDLQERSGCHVNIVGEEKSINGLRPVNLIGTPQAAATAKDLIMEIVDSDTKNLTSQGTSAGRVVGSMGGDSGDKINDVIIVPSEAVGMIIGKGGETIKEMQNTTGCKINVTPASGRDIEREIGLVGSRGAVEAAKAAIMEKVHAVEEKNRPGGGQRDQRDQRDDRYNGRNDQYTQNQQPYGQQQNVQAQAQPGGDAADPYAAYGGYQNYVALWYSSLQAQGQQQQQQQPGDQRPPGS